MNKADDHKGEPRTAATEAAPATAPEDRGGPCGEDWAKCKDNADIANNFRGWVDAKVACKMAAEEQATYGTPTWPWLAFGSFLKGRSYLGSGDAVLIEPDAQFDNGLGSKVHVRVVCHYDLGAEKVTNIIVGGRD